MVSVVDLSYEDHYPVLNSRNFGELGGSNGDDPDEKDVAFTNGTNEITAVIL